MRRGKDRSRKWWIGSSPAGLNESIAALKLLPASPFCPVPLPGNLFILPLPLSKQKDVEHMAGTLDSVVLARPIPSVFFQINRVTAIHRISSHWRLISLLLFSYCYIVKCNRAVKT